MAGFVIQATGTVEFEDGLWIGNHLKARNGLQRVRTIPGLNQESVAGSVIQATGTMEFEDGL